MVLWCVNSSWPFQIVTTLKCFLPTHRAVRAFVHPRALPAPFLFPLSFDVLLLASFLLSNPRALPLSEQSTEETCYSTGNLEFPFLWEEGALRQACRGEEPK